MFRHTLYTIFDKGEKVLVDVRHEGKTNVLSVWLDGKKATNAPKKKLTDPRAFPHHFIYGRRNWKMSVNWDA